MLELKNIKKDYKTSTETVHALKGISIKFREKEFVAILGQSGCGKTTLLNIIGGLDHYTSGDLIINGKSTKEFKDREWDSYRNHSIGFVFQSYNLIPHQNILSNVELALTISGVSKKERRKRAKEALEKVGLGDKIHQRPNELSGGQMQRVAIARAIVNNPDIILADEPTGALDTKTSVQVMEILKEISKEHLVIMVTHNPDLAEKYATRTIRILDGEITDDSNPYNEENENIDKSKKKKPSMSFLTALSLSLNNLMTKKGRTILTAFAGSIGIIGIALILALSTGVQNYINNIEEETLSSYPVTIEESTIDLGGMMTSLMDNESEVENREDNKIYAKYITNSMLDTFANDVKSNNLKKFKEYLESSNSIKDYANAIQYSYDLNLNLYKSDTSNGVIQVNPSTVAGKMGMETMVEAGTDMLGSNSAMMSSVNVFSELFDNQEMLDNQYELLDGKWPENYNEVVVIVDKNNEISDYTLYSLGIMNQDEIEEKMSKIENNEEIEENEEQVSYNYNDFLNLTFKMLLNSDYYDKENGTWVDRRDNKDYIKEKVDSAEAIKVVGIVKQKENSVSSNTQGGIGYTKALTEYVINKAKDADIVKEQIDNPEVNVFTGLDFPEEGEEEEFSLDNLSMEQKMQLASMNAEDLRNLLDAYAENSEASYDGNLKKLGVIDLNSPTSISIYPKDFDAKEAISNAITEYNNLQENENDKINYTDTVGIMMNSVSTIVDTISYVLIAFVAISLIVSSIMIGIITYISVLERTKEIGILRAIGASKKDISRVFNAETFITGLVSGLLGIGVTVLLTIPINAVILSITGVNVEAFLPWQAGIILVLISMFLTIIAGLIPAKMASKCDPVKALRTE